MKVLKFGGTSVGSVESILNVKKIVESQNEPVIVVVSALGGVTDKLIKISKMAVSGDSSYQTEYDELAERHRSMIETIIPEGDSRKELMSVINALLEELKSIYYGVYLIRDLSQKTSSTIVSYGERLSSHIAAVLINGAKWYDSRTFIKTEIKSGRQLLASELTMSLVRQTFAELPDVALVPGFIDSPMFRKATDSDPMRRDKILGRTPMGRYGDAEDIGWGAVYLSSKAARFITGTELIIDGGCSIGF